MERRPRICIVGSANMDLLCKVPRLPKLGETLVGHYFQMGCGGKGSNQAVMAAKLGARVTMVAKLGRDPFGVITFKNYQDLGIDTGFVFWDEQHFSGVAPIFVDDAGRNMIVIVPGANMALSPGNVREAAEAIRRADVVVCQLEIPVESTVEAFRIAKAAGKRTILNPAPACPISDELLQLSGIAAPNETEAELLTGMHVSTLEEAEAAARLLLRRGTGAVVITLGERGALLLENGNATHIPALKVDAVDTTGAGDAFIGSMAYFLAEGRSLREAIERANAIAAMSVMKVGTQVSFPTRKEVAHLMGD
jgi:ribokinase